MVVVNKKAMGILLIRNVLFDYFFKYIPNDKKQNGFFKAIHIFIVSS